MRSGCLCVCVSAALSSHTVIHHVIPEGGNADTERACVRSHDAFWEGYTSFRRTEGWFFSFIKLTFLSLRSSSGRCSGGNLKDAFSCDSEWTSELLTDQINVSFSEVTWGHTRCHSCSLLKLLQVIVVHLRLSDRGFRILHKIKLLRTCLNWVHPHWADGSWTGFGSWQMWVQPTNGNFYQLLNSA